MTEENYFRELSHHEIHVILSKNERRALIVVKEAHLHFKFALLGMSKYQLTNFNVSTIMKS